MQNNVINIDMDAHTDEFLEDLSLMPVKIKDGRVPVSIEDDPPSDEDVADEEVETADEDSLVEVEHHEILSEQEKKMQADMAEADKTQQYVLASCKKIVDQGFDTLSNLQDTVIGTADGKTISGYANLIGSIAKILDTANTVAMNNQRMAHQMKLEMLKSELKSKAVKNAQPSQKNTINIVAGREEIMKMLENV